MRRRAAILFAAALVSVFSAAACGGVGEDIQQRAEDEVRQRVDEEVQRGRTQIEEQVDRGVTQAEDQIREGLQQREGGQ